MNEAPVLVLVLAGADVRRMAAAAHEGAHSILHLHFDAASRVTGAALNVSGGR